MSSVTNRIKMITQPHGGYIPPKTFTREKLNDGIRLNGFENIHGSVAGLTVDYLTRVIMGTSPRDAFDISLKGASMIGADDIAEHLLSYIDGNNPVSIVAAAKLVVFDTVYRAGVMPSTLPQDINPDEATIENISTMLNRSETFFDTYGPLTQDGFTFEGGYSQIITTGDGDFLTQNTLWDMKVLRSNITSQHTLQVLVYYLMGKRSIHSYYDDIDSVGFFNPRSNEVFILKISDIDEDIIHQIERDVIGY